MTGSATPMGIIAAVTRDGVIGRGGTIPFRYPGDLRRFRRLTLDSTVIMGRATWVSLGAKPLPRRRNLVLTSRPMAAVECFSTVASALAACAGPVWIIGGAEVYREALNFADFIDLTHVPDIIPVEGSVLFPPIDPELWIEETKRPHEDEPLLFVSRFVRRATTSEVILATS